MTYKKEDVVKVCEVLINPSLHCSHNSRGTYGPIGYMCRLCGDMYIRCEDINDIIHKPNCPVLIAQKILKDCEV